MAEYKVCNLGEALQLKRIHSRTISASDLKKQIAYSIKVKIFAIHHLSLPLSNYLSVLDALSNIIFPLAFSKKIEKIKIKFRKFLYRFFLIE